MNLHLLPLFVNVWDTCKEASQCSVFSRHTVTKAFVFSSNAYLFVFSPFPSFSFYPSQFILLIFPSGNFKEFDNK